MCRRECFCHCKDFKPLEFCPQMGPAADVNPQLLNQSVALSFAQIATASFLPERRVQLQKVQFGNSGRFGEATTSATASADRGSGT